MDEPGIWTVQVDVLHDGDTSAGPVEPPYPTGGMLGSDGGSYRFFVVDPAAPTLDAGLDHFNIAELTISDFDLRADPSDPSTKVPSIDPIYFFLDVPAEWTDVEADYVIRMPGFILETGRATPANDKVVVVYDPVSLSADFPNVDLRRRQDREPGLADEVMVTVSLLGRDASGAPVRAAKLLTLVGEDIYDLN